MINRKSTQVYESGGKLYYGKGRELAQFPSMFKEVKAHITNGQILDLPNNPIELISSPGEGKFIDILNVTCKLNFVSIPFDSTYLFLAYNSKIPDTYTAWSSDQSIMSAEDRIFSMYKDGPPWMTANDGVSLVSFTGLSGNSSIDLYIVYRIITL
jgi:hypothetical protein